jgi:PEP-CTERM motif
MPQKEIHIVTKRTLFKLVASLVLLSGITPASHAQFSWVFYGGRLGTSTTDVNRGIINQINSTTGAESIGVNLLNFSTFSSLTFKGTNGLAYDRASDRVYFSLTSGSAIDGRNTATQGDMGVYYWNRTTNTVGSLLSFSGLTTPDQNGSGTNINRQINADSAFTYNGYYYFLQDQGVDSTPEMYRISLTASSPTLERFQDYNGTNTRNYYDFGDVAVSSGGMMYGSAGDGRSGRSNWWFSSNISGSTPGAMSSTGYTETTPSTTQQLYQMGFGWTDPNTQSGVLYGENSNGASGGTLAFSTIDTATGAPGAALFTGVRSYSDLTTAPILIPEPGTLALLGLGSLALSALRRRRRN